MNHLTAELVNFQHVTKNSLSAKLIFFWGLSMKFPWNLLGHLAFCDEHRTIPHFLLLGLGPCQISKMKLFAIVAEADLGLLQHPRWSVLWKLFYIKSFIANVWKGPKFSNTPIECKHSLFWFLCQKYMLYNLIRIKWYEYSFI